MEVPLTTSGTWNDAASADIDNIAWASLSAATHVSANGETSSGVVICTLAKAQKVVAKFSQEPARELFLTRICRHLGVSAPHIRLVPSYSDEYKRMWGALGRRGAQSMLPVVVVMEFVSGTTLDCMTPALAKLYFSCASPKSAPVLRSLGRIMALDVALNNWGESCVCACARDAFVCSQHVR